MCNPDVGYTPLETEAPYPFPQELFEQGLTLIALPFTHGLARSTAIGMKDHKAMQGTNMTFSLTSFWWPLQSLFHYPYDLQAPAWRSWKKMPMGDSLPGHWQFSLVQNIDAQRPDQHKVVIQLCQYLQRKTLSDKNTLR